MSWYKANCDQDWEHSYGVKIDTLDNPGWIVSIDIAETTQASEFFVPVKIDRSDSDWLYCKVSDEVFTGAGGVGNLEEIIEVFLDWAESHLDPTAE